MASRQMQVKIDENGPGNIGKLQAKRGLEPARRAALGELGNRAVLRNLKDGQKESKDLTTKCQMNLRNAKAKVDTFWKSTQSNINSNVVEKNVSRAKLQNFGTGNKTAASVNYQTQHKPTTITVKAVRNENGVQIKHNKPKSWKSSEEPQLKREESNLSRRSLRVLKAAISNDIKPQIKCVSVKTGLDAIVTVPVSKTKRNTDALHNKSIDSTSEGLKSDLKIISVQSHSSKLLSLVDNIDAEDTENPILVSEYVNDIYDYLYRLEVEMCIEGDHLKHQKEVTPKMRSVLIDWINEVHFQFHLAPETFQMTVAIIDRYLQVENSTPRQQLQLVGVTSLFIAAKYEELYPPPISDFVYITDDTYSKPQILKMEEKILKKICFNLARPLPIHFLRRFSKAAKAEEYHHEMAKYFLELSTVEYSLASYKPSQVAAGALYLSLELLRGSNDDSTEELWTPTLQFYSRYTPESLQFLVKELAAIAKNAPNAKLKAVYQKYQSSKFKKISLRPEICGSRIDVLIKH